jgi:hypothetical protein
MHRRARRLAIRASPTCPADRAHAVRRNSSGTRIIWLTAAAWQGLAVIIRQTPDLGREDVATLLDIVTSAVHDSAIAGLLAELVGEVRHDPYKDVPESDAHEYNFNSTWPAVQQITLDGLGAAPTHQSPRRPGAGHPARRPCLSSPQSVDRGRR